MILKFLNFKDKANIVDCTRDVLLCNGNIRSIEHINDDLLITCTLDFNKFKQTFSYKLT